MINFREALGRNDDNEMIRQLDATIANINKESETLIDFFKYIENNNLGIDLIQPQISQINNYVSENLRAIEKLKNEFSSLSPETLGRIEQAHRALQNITNELNKTKEIAEENGKTLEIAGSLD